MSLSEKDVLTIPDWCRSGFIGSRSTFYRHLERGLIPPADYILPGGRPAWKPERLEELKEQARTLAAAKLAEVEAEQEAGK